MRWKEGHEVRKEGHEVRKESGENARSLVVEFRAATCSR